MTDDSLQILEKVLTAKVPKWLKPTGVNFSQRNFIEGIDDLEGEGTALNTARSHPPIRWKTFKRVKRKLAEMEELHDWAENKESVEKINNLLDGLENALNSMGN